MWYIYVLESLKDSYKYVEFTEDLKRRFVEHNSDKFLGTYTYKHKPFKLIYYEAYQNKLDVQEAKKFYKTGYGREILKGKLKYYLS
jgi:predicted GIY-YIG superfamily endonuclease